LARQQQAPCQDPAGLRDARDELRWAFRRPIDPGLKLIQQEAADLPAPTVLKLTVSSLAPSIRKSNDFGAIIHSSATPGVSHNTIRYLFWSLSMNLAVLVGRLGADVESFSTTSGKGARFSVATDEGYKDRDSGQWVDRVEWHRVVTFQPGLVDMLTKHGRKGRLVNVHGKMRTTKFQDKDGADRWSTEVLVDGDGKVRFLDKLERVAEAAE
jgi:single-strand DNA-binding protein